MRPSMYAEPIPEDAEVFERLKISTREWEVNGVTRYGLKVWRGKATRTMVNYYYTSEENRAREIEGLKESETASLAFKAEMREDGVKRVAAMKEAMTVGTVLHGSWGYDQTNAELWEVVGRPSPGYVEIRKVKAEPIESEGLGMATYLRVLPGEVYGETVRKKITAYGVSFRHFTLSLVEDPESRKFYDSWTH